MSFKLLALDGNDGTVFCRVHGKSLTSIIPHTTENGVIEWSVRSRLRLENLKAVRGSPNKSMVGPCDYYGNWEVPYGKSFTINIKDGIPTIKPTNIQPIKQKQLNNIDEFVSTVRAKWFNINNIKEYDKPINTGDSLFESAGILEIDVNSPINLKYFNPVNADLSSFKARIVKNNEPFYTTTKPVQTSDEWRAVSYHYDKGYANRVVNDHSRGLFLEHHDFTQSITPLDESCGGFITLGRWKNKYELDLIGLQVPYGYTIIIEEGCIHGDTNVSGMFMMCMTSNHITMRTADTVFLKKKKDGKNVAINFELIDEDKEEIAPKPIVSYNMCKNIMLIKNKVMFNPLSKGWWSWLVGNRL